MEIKVKKLTADAFKKFGQVIQLPITQEPTIAGDCFAYWKQQAVFNIEGKTEIGILTLKKLDIRFSKMEKHLNTPQVFISLDGAFILPVAPASQEPPKVEQIEAFEIPKNAAVVIGPSCWHFQPNAVGEQATVMIILKDNTSKNDLTFRNLSEVCTIIPSCD